MTKTDYELTIGGKLRKVYKNSGGFFVKMNGGNLDVNEYFLKNGGGLKSKYKNKNKVPSKGKNKKKITGGYPLSLLKDNENLKKAVTRFMDFNEDSSVKAPDNFTLDQENISDDYINNNVKSIVENIIINFYNTGTTDTSTSTYDVKVNTPGIEVSIKLPLNDVTNDDSENIKNDITNFYKMYILYYFFEKYNEGENEQNLINNYKKFLGKAAEIKVNLVQTQNQASVGTVTEASV